MGNLVGIQFFSFCEGSGRASADFSDEWGQMFPDDDLAQPFMGEVMGMEKIVVKEMAKWIVSDVMNQGRHP